MPAGMSFRLRNHDCLSLFLFYLFLVFSFFIYWENEDEESIYSSATKCDTCCTDSTLRIFPSFKVDLELASCWEHENWVNSWERPFLFSIVLLRLLLLLLPFDLWPWLFCFSLSHLLEVVVMVGNDADYDDNQDPLLIRRDASCAYSF